MFQIQYYKEAGILTTSLEDEVLGLSNMKQFIWSCSWGIWIQVVCPTVYTLHYDIIVSHWCKVWSPGEYIWPSVEANQSLRVWTFKVNSGLLAFAFSLWWTKCKLLFGKEARKWSEWFQGFWTSNSSYQRTVQSLKCVCIWVKTYMDLTAIWFTKYAEPFRGYHGSKLNRRLCLAFSLLINSWLELLFQGHATGHALRSFTVQEMMLARLRGLAGWWLGGRPGGSCPLPHGPRQQQQQL